ncbi:hypothetical protein L1887_15827 [Cichorium endivia]|nr:hypothetical protein L1887_15827 [Cichorium endivia]
MWGVVVKMENCDFYTASTLVAGRVLVSTPYEFPLEKEIVIKLDDRKVWVSVKDEGWIDEIGDEGVRDDEESNCSASENEDRWEHDISDINSVKSFPAEEAWDTGDGQEVRKEESPQRARNACMDVPVTNVCAWPGSEKSNHDIGNIPSFVGESNGLQEKEIYNGTGDGDVARNKKQVEKTEEYVEVCKKKRYGPDTGMDHEFNDEAQDMNKNANNLKRGLEEIKAQSGDKINDDELDLYEDQWSDSQIRDLEYDELEEKKKRRNFNKMGKKVRLEKMEKEANRSSRKWDGSRSMRMFNKLVRDRYKRRSMVSGKGGAIERTMACPKIKLANQMSKSRDSTEDIQDLIEGASDDTQSLRKFGMQIGFTWDKNEEINKGVQTGESRGQEQ